MDILIDRLQKATEIMRLERIMRQVFVNENLDAVISDMNTEGQLWFGIRADETAIEPAYTRRTVTRKLKRGQPVDRVTLKDTGRFYASFRAILLPSGDIDIDATDSKIDALEAKYGDTITGLTPGNTERLRQRILRGVEKIIRSELGV
jgi:hypothetical protein